MELLMALGHESLPRMRRVQDTYLKFWTQTDQRVADAPVGVGGLDAGWLAPRRYFAGLRDCPGADRLALIMTGR